MLEGYDGYEWGWIVKDGTRQESGGRVTGEPPQIVGIWGKVYRTDITRPFYYETSREEGQTLEDLAVLNMKRSLWYAYPGDCPFPDTIKALPEQPAGKNMKMLQRWKCAKCQHTFYTDPIKRPPLRQVFKILKSFRLWKSFLLLQLECEICKQISCNKNGKVKKEVQS